MTARAWKDTPKPAKGGETAAADEIKLELVPSDAVVPEETKWWMHAWPIDRIP